VQLQLQLDRPAGATCLTFDFRFFSEEFPEFVGSQFYDTFSAEIIDTDLKFQNGSIVTPYNFAYGPEGNAISVNTVLGVTHDEETTFDGSTPLLQAVTPAELNDAEDVLVTLTIQDVGDSIYDSAVALDNFRWSSTPTCTPGASIADADGDALPDDWETAGLDVDDDGAIDVDLAAMGETPSERTRSSRSTGCSSSRPASGSSAGATTKTSRPTRSRSTPWSTPSPPPRSTTPTGPPESRCISTPAPGR
jgi:hypothetical protein